MTLRLTVLSVLAVSMLGCAGKPLVSSGPIVLYRLPERPVRGAGDVMVCSEEIRSGCWYSTYEPRAWGHDREWHWIAATPEEMQRQREVLHYVDNEGRPFQKGKP